MIIRENVRQIIYYGTTNNSLDTEFAVRFQDRDGEQSFVLVDTHDFEEIDDHYTNKIELDRKGATELRDMLTMILDEVPESED